MAEASSVMNAKNTSQSDCFICSGNFNDAKVLPCGHVFCYECLDTWYSDSKDKTDKTQVICPVCMKPSTIPKDGVGGFPTYAAEKDSKDTGIMDKKEVHAVQVKDSTKVSRIECEICNHTAVSHCIDCKKSLCPACINSHNSFMKDHHFVTMQDFQSGKVSSEGRICPLHGEQVRYYCMMEDKQVCMDCISLKTCPIEHVRVTLKEAAKNHSATITDLLAKCAKNKKRFQDGVAETQTDLKDLDKSIKQVKSELVTLKNQYVKKVDHTFGHQSSEVDVLHRYRIKIIDRRKQALEAGISKLDEACKEASKLLASKQEFLITHKFPTLSKDLATLSAAEPMQIAFKASYVGFEPIPMQVPPIGYIVRKKQWKLCDQFYTQGMNAPQAIAINYDGDIAIASFQKGIVIYSSDNQVKHSFLQDQQCLTDIVISNDNRYIVSNGADLLGIQYFDKKGRHLSLIPVTDTQNKQCNLNSIAVDAQGRIIAGMVPSTISIHYTNGEVQSKFTIKSHVYRLAITSKGDIVTSLLGKDSLELINYSGKTIKSILPPPQVKKWAPGYVCCSKSEIFVVNESSGKPLGVFRYTNDGEYLGCVTLEVTDPRGIALSHDGMELFVVERKDNQVKVFHRE